MLRPTDIESLKGDKSRYAIVVGVAKRAREIAEQSEAEGVILIEKPVSIAIGDLTNGDYKILMPAKSEEGEDAFEEELAHEAEAAHEAKAADIAEEDAAE